MEISHLNHRQIDRKKWDECILQAENSLIYANSWYLDIVSPNWEALIQHNYNSVFPLPVKRKLGIPYISHPLYAQQLGLFFKDEGENEVDIFIEGIPKKYLKVVLRLNSKGFTGKYSLSERKNYILPLSNIIEIEKSFNQNTKRNIKKFESYSLTISDNLNTAEFIKLKKSTAKAKLSAQEWHRMELLINEILHRNYGFFKAVYEDDELLSAVFFTKWKNRICYLFSTSSAKGMEKRSSFGIISNVIRENSKQGIILDFEGSMDDNVARFFKGFGAIQEIYYELKK